MRVRVKDVVLAVEERGRGRPLLFIHGYLLSAALWMPQIEGLVDVARIITPDLRGHGESDASPGPYTMELLAEDCRDILDAMGIFEPVVVCGLSMGGYIAFAFYRNYPERVAGLILAATRAANDTLEGRANRDKAADLARQGGTGAIAESMLQKMFAPKTYLERPDLVQSLRGIMQGVSLDGILGDLMGMKTRLDSTPTLDKINRPTLILHGSDDQLIPLGDAIAMQSAIAGAVLRVLPDSGHLLNLEQTELFNQTVREYLEELQR